MHHITTLQERCHLSNDRKHTCREPKIPPNKEMKSPEVITHRKKNRIQTKKTDPVLLKLEAEITILTYPPNRVDIYTNGSATVNAGCGVYACLLDGTSRDIYGACGETFSNYEAEAIGIQSALELLKTTLNKHPTAQKCSDFLRFSISTPGAARRNGKRN
ncbi:hypothetical protein ElyMa_003509000 [Elysia marginata]|uniref:RNase H type-1 domain-containing protein n=1 Tax=Elysia marginata TaxID=1093978 RepID=A0AAV4EFH5_9GAST|nr:hypothetical protein ElyMa_003509000 [Elysia marginata]